MSKVVNPSQVSEQLAVYLGYLISKQPGQSITFNDTEMWNSVHGKALDKSFNPESGLYTLALVDDPNHNHADHE